MVRRTDAAYGCGPLALFNAARQLSGTAPVELLEIASPATGFSFQKQVELAGKFLPPMVAAVRKKGTQMVTPAAVHWRKNPYAAVIAEQDCPQVQSDDCPLPNGGNCCEECKGGYNTGGGTDAFGMATGRSSNPTSK
jgi:hypothetical protein